MKNLQIRSKPYLHSNLFVYDLARFYNVRPYLRNSKDSALFIYCYEDLTVEQFRKFSVKAYKVKQIVVPPPKYKIIKPTFELFMKGMYMLNPVLIGNRENTTVFSVQCDAVRETEEEAKAYLVAQELMK